MNFFEHQQRALRNTAWLVALFVLALAATVTLMAGALGLAWGVLQWFGLDLYEQAPITRGVDPAAAPFGAIVQLLARTWRHLVPATLVWGAGIALAAAMLAAAALKLRALAPGGVAVARMLEAREIAPAGAGPLERRLRNVVAEMAIAAALPMPRVFVLDRQPGINALTAGFSPRDAVIVVTRGTLAALRRDELQGVVAHEFSHILHGDVRLNTWMIVLLAGLGGLNALGARLLGASLGAGALLGMPLVALGALGQLFARLIQAAVSRQREYLADASAVRFTRDAEGLAAALARIERHRAGSVVAHPAAGALGHLFFAASVLVWLERVFATHPPLRERIARVAPRFNAGRYLARSPDLTEDEILLQALRELEAPASVEGAVALAAGPAQAQATMASVGAPTREHVDTAAGTLRRLPAALHDALATADGARAVLLALALNREAVARERQLALIAAEDALLARIVGQLGVLLGGVSGPAARLPVIELALPALGALGPAERAAFLGLLRRVLAADGRVTLREFVLATLLEEALGGRKPAARPVRFRRLAQVGDDARLVLSLLAHAAARADEAAAIFAAALGCTGLAREVALLPLSEITLDRVAASLERLAALAPLEKPALLKGCIAAVQGARAAGLAEAELLRAVAAAIDCPLPPGLGAGPDHEAATSG